ncbi:hypothetical protein PIB30_078482 [Stylosanthes scabra]|uniref:Uncharacterized protein n=1 Tax=Stylosanthes scabra TaxID=79078 RepID=A0ABU6YRM9_9FABA|nr:hypothetical protein [Stylosanthes scabra]
MVGGIIQTLDGVVKEIKDKGLTTISSDNQHLLCNLLLLKNLLNWSERPSNTFPSDTIPNPREECKTVKLRSGKTVRTEPKDKELAEDSSHQHSQPQQQEIANFSPLSEK